jgi:hypothetical protein
LNRKALVGSLLDIAGKVAPLIVPGAPKTIEAARAVIDLIDKVSATVGQANQAKLQEGRAALEARVNAHADRTIASLG